MHLSDYIDKRVDQELGSLNGSMFEHADELCRDCKGTGYYRIANELFRCECVESTIKQQVLNEVRAELAEYEY